MFRAFWGGSLTKPHFGVTFAHNTCCDGRNLSTIHWHGFVPVTHGQLRQSCWRISRFLLPRNSFWNSWNLAKVGTSGKKLGNPHQKNPVNIRHFKKSNLLKFRTTSEAKPLFLSFYICSNACKQSTHRYCGAISVCQLHHWTGPAAARDIGHQPKDHEHLQLVEFMETQRQFLKKKVATNLRT